MSELPHLRILFEKYKWLFFVSHYTIEKRQERFQNFQDKYEQADEELLRNIKNDVDLLLINGTT